MATPPRAEDIRGLLSIYDQYKQIVTTWAGYTDPEEDGTDDVDWDNDEDRITDELLEYRESWSDRGSGSGTGHDPVPHTPKTGWNASRHA
ncbi:MAG: hypothetical protein KAR19_18820 [Bacteroidales bacterium]|nr:hypothetical protein [Bacteroidales bacterium]